MSNSNDINYSLISAVRRGKLKKTRELINSYGLSYCAGWSNGYVLLRDAVKANRTSIAKLLLMNGSKVNSKSSSIKPSNTPLHYAVLNGNIEIVRLILGKGANVNVINDNGSTPLHVAVDNNKIEIAELLLENGADVNAANKYNNTPLHKAVDRNKIEIAELLLENGADVNAANKNNNTPLHTSVSKNILEISELLLKNGADVNAANKYNNTLLHKAAYYNKIEIAELLLKNGADVNATNKRNITALHKAADNNNIEIAELLLNHGACVHTLTEGGYTPLHLASLRGNYDIVQLLLNKGADINASTKNGLTPLHIATDGGNIRLLVENGAKVDIEDAYGKTVLYKAVEKGRLKIVKDVLSSNPDIDNHSNKNSLKIALLGNGEQYKKICKELLNYGFTVSPEEFNNSHLLHSVVEKGYFTIIEDLLKIGADVNTLHDSKFSKDRGFSLLHRAVRNKQREIAKLLISFEADVNAKDETGKTPLFYAITNIDLKMTNILLRNGAKIKASSDLLNITVKIGCIKIIEALLHHGADVNARDESGRTALHYTASIEKQDRLSYLTPSSKDIIINKRGKIAKMLLKRGADVDARTNDGDTTLHFASSNGYKKVVKALLEYNSDANIVDQNYKTPLHLSAEKGFPEICKMLLDKDINVDSKSKDGTTPLIAAIKKGHGEVVKVLLERAARVENDFTPLHLAVINGHRKIIESILTFGADVNYRDKDGRTALLIASLDGRIGTVETLLRFGSDINIICRQNKTALLLVLDEFESRQYRYYNIDQRVVSCKIIVDYLKKHVLKMKTANMYLLEENEIKILKEDEELFVMECKQEILKLKSQKMADSNITFYNFLHKSTSSLAKSLRNNNIVQVLISNHYKKEFPNYAILIESNYRKAMEKLWLLNQLDNNCLLFNSCPKLPYNCTEKILSYLSNTDLRLLLEAYRPL